MIVTSEEAKDLVCCSDPSLYCVGDKCMAWKQYFAKVRTKHRVGEDKDDELIPTDKGYCGLTRR